MPSTTTAFRHRSPALWLGLGAAAALLSVGARFDLPLLAWAAPVFLLRFSRRSAAALGLPVIAIVSTASVLWWMAALAVPVTPLVSVGGLAFGIAYTLPYVVDRLAAPRANRWGRILLFPAALMSVEFLLGTFGPFGTAYGLRAATQHDANSLLQLTAITGPYAIAFLIGLSGSVLNTLWEEGRTRFAVRSTAALAAVLGLAVLGGQLRLGTAPTGADSVRVAGINPSRAAMDAETEIHGHSRLAVTDPRLVEHDAVTAAAPGVLDDLFAQAARVADEEDVYLLTADLTYLPDAPHGRDETHFFGPDGRLLATYEKARPIPGLEIYEPGDGVVPVVDTPHGRIATVICFDADFPDLARIDADILLVPGGDWPEMGRTHTGMAGLRAIENGYNLVRQDFNGQSAAFDSYGRVLSTQDTTHDSGVWYADVPTAGTGSVYRAAGDVLAWLALIGTLAITVTAAARPRDRRAS
ncbi:nitrilase-related carbon-nitrogen hydrolase [Marinactinospora rubrisoli]|uniref:Nitrilase-related carbon-nitrogen hydrolase n=1 Tax=Marinactinospora rubrisoli TaxID=2715399 RepID=A0ABW2KL44_9ACTN